MSSHIMCILIGLISFNFFFLHKTAEFKRTKKPCMSGFTYPYTSVDGFFFNLIFISVD